MKKGVTGNDLYIVSFYWCVTTITTVGYGDINVINTYEQVFCAIVMIFGVVGFSFVTGTFTSIISNLDNSKAKM